jgi:hypothetical protein
MVCATSWTPGCEESTDNPAQSACQKPISIPAQQARVCWVGLCDQTMQESTIVQQSAQSERSTQLKLGFGYGLLIGLALALGAWALDVVALASLPVRLGYAPLLLGLLALLSLGGLAGLLAARFRSGLGGLITWAVAAFLMNWVISHVPYEAYNLTVWLADRRFWGLPVRPFEEGAQARFWLSSFFILLLLAILGMLQDYRLEGFSRRLSARGNLETSAWIALLLPLPLVVAVGLVADNFVNRPLRAAPQVVHQAINTSLAYTGDLFQLSLVEGVNYSAMSGFQDEMSPGYELFIGEIELAAQTVYVVSHFDNGFWMTCRVAGTALTFCYDASRPYVEGFSTLLTSGEQPEDCPACRFRVTDELKAWLQEHSANLQQPEITRVAQWGNYVLMRAQAPGAGSAIECRFHGTSPIFLEACWTVQAP